LKRELTVAQYTLEQRERELTGVRTTSAATTIEIEKLQFKLYDARLERAQQRELLEGDLHQERELVALQDQRTAVADDQRACLSRKVESLKRLARKAADEAAAQKQSLLLRIRQEADAGVSRVRESELRRREELEERLRKA